MTTIFTIQKYLGSSEYTKRIVSLNKNNINLEKNIFGLLPN